MPETIEIVHGIFCEHARVERDNKISLLGMYGKKCIFSDQFPLQCSALTFHLMISNEEQQDIKGNISFHFPGATEPIVNEFEVKGVKGMTGNNLNVGFFNIPILREGKLVASVNLVQPYPLSKDFSLEMTTSANQK